MTILRHLCLGVMLSLSTQALLAKTLIVAIPKDVLADYQKFVGKQDVLQIVDFSGDNARRDVVEVVLLQQALRLGGNTDKIEFKTIDSYARILRELESGQVLIAANSIWLADLKPLGGGIHISQAVVENGASEAMLYTLPTNAHALKAKTLGDVRQLRAISNQAWTADWLTLSSLKLPYLQSASTWVSMVQMVSFGRADYLLGPFPKTADLSMQAEGVRFVAIPQVKVRLMGSRHFVVSRRHPDGAGVFTAINAGLSHLKAKHVIEKAYTESGFQNPNFKDWHFLN